MSELAERVKDRFRTVSVVTTDPQGNLPRIQHVQDGFDIYRIRAFAPSENYHFPLVPSLFKRLKECPSQILHLHGIHDAPGPLAGIFGGKGAVLFTAHFSGQIHSRLGKFLFAGYRPLLRQLVERVAFVICVSRFEARAMSEVLPESAGKIRIIPNGVDFDLLSRYRWRQPDEPSILYAGRLEKHKNIDKIIQAFERIRRNDPNVGLTIVGRGVMKDELVGLTRNLGLEGGVKWIDGVPREELYNLYAHSSVVVLPSDLECFGLVAAEAISLGVPTIVADSSALSEFVRAELAQPIEPPVDVGKLEAKISEVLENPQSFAPRWESHGPILSWEEVADRTYDLYESVLKR